MCRTCWSELGSPAIDTPAVRDAASAIEAVYASSDGAGNLHIAIDDWNLGDEDLDFCAGAIEEDVQESSGAGLAAERRCLESLRPLTLDERASALALREKFWASHALPELPVR